MLESLNNNLNNNEGETQRLSNQVLENPQQNVNGGLTIALEIFSSVEGPGCWKIFVPELMKMILYVPPEMP